MIPERKQELKAEAPASKCLCYYTVKINCTGMDTFTCKLRRSAACSEEITASEFCGTICKPETSSSYTLATMPIVTCSKTYTTCSVCHFTGRENSTLFNNFKFFHNCKFYGFKLFLDFLFSADFQNSRLSLYIPYSKKIPIFACFSAF